MRFGSSAVRLAYLYILLYCGINLQHHLRILRLFGDKLIMHRRLVCASRTACLYFIIISVSSLLKHFSLSLLKQSEVIYLQKDHTVHFVWKIYFLNKLHWAPSLKLCHQINIIVFECRAWLFCSQKLDDICFPLNNICLPNIDKKKIGNIVITFSLW